MRAMASEPGIVCSSAGGRLGPVVLTRTSIPPSTPRASASALTTASSSVASTRTKVTEAPGTLARQVAAAASPRSGLRPKSTSRQPASANCAAASRPTPAVPPRMATPASPRGSVLIGALPFSARRASEHEGVIAVQRAVPLRAAGGAQGRQELGIDQREMRQVRRDVVLMEDRLDRAGVLTRPAGDALLGMDVEHALAGVDAVDRARGQAGAVDAVDARFGDHIGHRMNSGSRVRKSRPVTALAHRIAPCAAALVPTSVWVTGSPVKPGVADTPYSRSVSTHMYHSTTSSNCGYCVRRKAIWESISASTSSR